LEVGGWLLAAGCWLLAAGCWLLAAGCWLLAAGCWLLALNSESQSHFLKIILFNSNILSLFFVFFSLY
jgi:hypothetical protein